MKTYTLLKTYTHPEEETLEGTVLFPVPIRPRPVPEV